MRERSDASERGSDVRSSCEDELGSDSTGEEESEKSEDEDEFSSEGEDCVQEG